jgi:flagellar hook-length control protein FliK
VVAAREAELSAEAGSQDDETSQHRSRDRNSSVVQKVDSARSENASIPPTTANRFAQQLTTQGAERSAGMQISEADHRRFVDRVARALPTAEGRGGTLRLRLSPPELGALRLEVKVLNGALTARVEAETPLARSLLLDSLPVLRERLEDQGVRVDQFDVDLLDRQAAETPDGLEQQRDQQDDTPADREAVTKQDESTDEPVGQIVRTLTGDEQLNVII